MGRRPQANVEALLRRLATTARSFILYDVRNDAVRRSVEALLDAFARTLHDYPILRLDVRPFEIDFEGTRVYVDGDRERSLAFRLYRDGVRVLVFREGFREAELARLLEILSLRYTGVHRHEEDTVTLLWKAGLRFLDVVAVEGASPDSGVSDGADGTLPAEPRPYLPEDAELPRLSGLHEAEPRWTEIVESDLEELRAGASPQSLFAEIPALVSVLREALDHPEESMPLEEALKLFEEIRDVLLCVEGLGELQGFVGQLRRIAVSEVEWDPGRHAMAVGLLTSCGSDRAVRRLIHSVPAHEHRLPMGMVELLDLVCPDPFTAVAEALVAEDKPSGRAVARQLLQHYGRRRGSHLRQRFDVAQGRHAADLLRSLAGLEGEMSAAFLARQCGHRDPEVRAEALWHLERTPFTPAVGSALVEALRRTSGGDRRRVLALVEKTRDRRFVAPLFAFVQSGAAEAGEAVEVARVLGRLEGPSALERWQGWLRPRGRFLRRRLPGTPFQQTLAAAAVAEVPGEQATHLLRLASSAARGEVRHAIEKLLDARSIGVRGEAA